MDGVHSQTLITEDMRDMSNKNTWAVNLAKSISYNEVLFYLDKVGTRWTVDDLMAATTFDRRKVAILLSALTKNNQVVDMGDKVYQSIKNIRVNAMKDEEKAKKDEEKAKKNVKKPEKPVPNVGNELPNPQKDREIGTKKTDDIVQAVEKKKKEGFNMIFVLDEKVSCWKVSNDQVESIMKVVIGRRKKKLPEIVLIDGAMNQDKCTINSAKVKSVQSWSDLSSSGRTIGCVVFLSSR